MYETLVIVPTLRSHALRYRLFDQLWHDKGVGKVLVYDNGNSFGIPDKKKQIWSKIQIVRPGQNLGWAASCIAGMEAALAVGMPYVACLNDDVTLSPNYFLALRDSVRAQTDVGLVSSLYSDKFCAAAHCAATRKTWRPQSREVDVPYIDGTCMFMPLSTIQRVGVLDPGFDEPHWGLDVDYSWRVRQAGLRVIVTQRAMLWHAGGMTGDQVYGGKQNRLRKGQEQLGRNLAAKYGEDWRRVMSPA